MIALLLLALVSRETLADHWRLLQQPDPITDVVSTFAAIGGPRQFIAVGCDDDKRIRIMFRTDWHILGRARRGLLAGGREMIYRFDQRAPVSRFWSYENDSAFENDPLAAALFIQQLRESRTLHVRARNSQLETLDFTFTYPDPSEVAEQVMRVCGVTP